MLAVVGFWGVTSPVTVGSIWWEDLGKAHLYNSLSDKLLIILSVYSHHDFRLYINLPVLSCLT